VPRKANLVPPRSGGKSRDCRHFSVDWFIGTQVLDGSELVDVTEG